MLLARLLVGFLQFSPLSTALDRKGHYPPLWAFLAINLRPVLGVVAQLSEPAFGTSQAILDEYIPIDTGNMSGYHL